MTFVVLSVSALISALGCGSDTTGPAPLTPATAYWALQLNQHAVNLALHTTSGSRSPVDTFRFRVTALNANGAPLTITQPVTYATTDSSIIVDSTGLVTGHFVTSGSPVIARVQMQNVTLTDTALVQVTDTALHVPLTAFAIHSTTGTSTTCHFNAPDIPLLDDCGPITLTASDQLGNTVSNALLVSYQSSNPLAASIDQTGAITTLDTGHVTFSATTWAYGVSRGDSLRYVIGFSRAQLITIISHTPLDDLTSVLSFNPSSITLATGGSVAWQNSFTQQMDVVFDDSAAVQPGCLFDLCQFYSLPGSGNIPPFGINPSGATTTLADLGIVARSFPVPGVYHYHSRLFPTSTGTVVVQSTLP